MKPLNPAALLDPRQPRAPKIIREGRLDICRECEHFMATRQCGICFCFMDLKTMLANAECPVGKWVAVEGVPK